MILIARIERAREKRTSRPAIAFKRRKIKKNRAGQKGGEAEVVPREWDISIS